MPDSPERIQETARAFQPSRILLTAVELGIFGLLGDGRPRKSSAVATTMETDLRATDRLMNALAALGFLIKDGDQFHNSPDVEEFLVPGKPNYIGGGLMHTVHLWDTWSTLTDAVKKGHSVITRSEEGREEWVKPFIAAMNTNASRLAGAIVRLLDLSGVSRVLDVGGGSGAYSIEFCRARPEIEATVFDLPDVVPLTREYIAQAGMSNRVGTIKGDYTVDELGHNYDLVFLSQIIHSNSVKENTELFRRCYEALNSGGRIVIQDFIVDDSRTSPAHAAIFALNMLVGTDSGDTYTEAEAIDWFRQAGFTFSKRLDPASTGTTLLIGIKSS